MTSNLNAHELLVSMRGGNLDAADVLFSAYAHPMYWEARNQYRFSDEDAWEVVLETFAKLLTSRRAYNPERAGGLKWIWRIFRNTAIDMKRQKPTVELTEEILCDVHRGDADDFDPIEHAGEEELAKIVGQALASLSEADQKVIEAYILNSKPGPKPRSLIEALARLRQVFFELNQ
jgi:RNA polymerase sigma factor (sigma-70 family)